MNDLLTFITTPAGMMVLAAALGFIAVALAKFYGLFFMRWKSPFRMGDNMDVRHAEVVEWANGEGYVSAGGELWQATSTDELHKGDPVTVAATDGLRLKVNRAAE